MRLARHKPTDPPRRVRGLVISHRDALRSRVAATRSILPSSFRLPDAAEHVFRIGVETLAGQLVGDHAHNENVLLGQTLSVVA